MSDQIFWYATRAAGIMAWFSGSMSVFIGVLLPSRLLGRRPTIPWLTDLHRFLAAMTVFFTAVHMVTLWADSFVSYGWAELLVPGVATARGVSRVGLALGVVSAWLLAAIQISSLAMRHLPTRVWRWIHLSAYAVVVMTSVHGWQAGSDATNPLLGAAAASTLAAATVATGIRLSRYLEERKLRYDRELRSAAPR